MSEEAMEAIGTAAARVMSVERELSQAVRERDLLVVAAVKGGVTQSAVSRAAGVSRERVRQIMVAS
jgi:DNA-directed RNA polymerase sigma subunit (sigma70/sigma32)